MNSPVDQALLQLIHQNIHSLENEVKNWCDEHKDEREKVQRQLQKVARGFKEINQRLLRLETGHQRLETEQQRLETGHQRLETEQQRLETGHQRLETEQQRLETGHQRLKTGLKRSRKDHERLKTKQRRLESCTRDVVQRVIQCEGTPTFKKKKGYYMWEARSVHVLCFLLSPSFLVINNTSDNVLLLLRLKEKKTINKMNMKYLKGQSSVEHTEKNVWTRSARQTFRNLGKRHVSREVTREILVK